MRRKAKPVFFVATTEAGKIVSLTTKRPTAAGLARIGEPVKIELLARPPRQMVMDVLEAEAFALHS